MMEELCCVSPTIMSGGKWVEEWNSDLLAIKKEYEILLAALHAKLY